MLICKCRFLAHLIQDLPSITLILRTINKQLTLWGGHIHQSDIQKDQENISWSVNGAVLFLQYIVKPAPDCKFSGIGN